MSAQPEQREWIGNEVQLRWLPETEYYRLQFLFMANGGALPDPAMSRIVIAEDQNGDIVGCFCLQLVAHAEPIWVSEDYRRRGVAKLLVDEINEHCDAHGISYYSFAEDERVEHLVQENNMKKLPYMVYWRKPEEQS